MYLNRLNFALYQQVESPVSISIVLVKDSPSLCDHLLHSKVELP